jgi:hypothetical protein
MGLTLQLLSIAGLILLILYLYYTANRITIVNFNINQHGLP